MVAYLTAHPPVRDQWYGSRNRPLTGCTVLHTTESVFDEIGEDTGAEGVVDFIRTRTTPGSYHDVADSDSNIYTIDYRHGAYHDGTGSNNWALALAFACRTTDWRQMTPTKRKAILRQGAIAFARQQAYRRSIGAPPTELRLITKAQSDAGMSGLTYHGFRDPDRRTDPGIAAPNLFPFDEFIAECRVVLGGSAPEEDDMYGPDQRFELVTLGQEVLGNTRSTNGEVARNAIRLERIIAALEVRPVDADELAQKVAALIGTDALVERIAERIDDLSTAQVREALADVVDDIRLTIA